MQNSFKYWVVWGRELKKKTTEVLINLEQRIEQKKS